MRNDLFRAIIAERQDAAAIGHQGAGALGDGDEAVGRHVHGQQEIVEAGVDIEAAQLILVGKADRVNDEVEPAPALLDLREGGVELVHVGDVAVDQEVGADLLGKRPHALGQRIALIGEGEFRTLGVKLLGDAPGQRLVVGQPHDEAALSCHQACHIVVPFPLSCAVASASSSGNSASAAFNSAPITTPSPTRKKKMSVIMTPARLP